MYVYMCIHIYIYIYISHIISYFLVGADLAEDRQLRHDLLQEVCLLGRAQVRAYDDRA